MRWVVLACVLASTPALAQNKPAAALKSTAVAKPAEKPDPFEFTNDPVLGKAPRITGKEVSGVVTFTFDDGPDAETTPAVLDALQKYDVPATFFVVTRRLLGKHGEKPRELLARTIADGHVIASHSVTHQNLRGADAKKLDKEVTASFKMLAKEAKQPIGMFRAPFGAIDAAGRARLKKHGVTEVFWSIDTLDWQATKSEKLRKKVFDMIVKQNGGVVLMHDVKPITAKIIGDVLDDLEAENCRRLKEKLVPIYPVSIHYFVRNGKAARPVPAEVTKRTDAYKAALPGRCAKRPVPTPPAAATGSGVPAATGSAAGSAAVPAAAGSAAVPAAAGSAAVPAGAGSAAVPAPAPARPAVRPAQPPAPTSPSPPRPTSVPASPPAKP